MPPDQSGPGFRCLDAVGTGEERTLLIEARKLAHGPATTKDDHTVEIAADVSNLELARAALEDEAEGVGLLRFEFVYLERQSLPDEEEQLAAYRSILDVFLAVCQ